MVLTKMRALQLATALVFPFAWACGEGCNNSGEFHAAGGAGGELSSGLTTGSLEPNKGDCNPFTGAPCNVSEGETCDYDTGSAFSCFPPPNSGKVCEPCHTADHPDFCALGSTCLDSHVCAAFCCDDSDCGSGRCDKSCLGRSDVGVCVLGGSGTGGGTGGSGGTGGGGGAGGGTGGGSGGGSGGGTGSGTGNGTGGAAPGCVPACDVPVPAPSLGACFGKM